MSCWTKVGYTKTLQWNWEEQWKLQKSKARDLGLVSRANTGKKNTVFGEQFNQAYKDFEYVGGYINNISPFTLKCKKCDNVFERNASSLRRRVAIRCDVCYEAEVIESKLARQKELERVQKIRETKAQKLRAIRLITNRLKRYVDDVERNKQLENHVCKECLSIFKAKQMGTIYCSDTCKGRVADRKRRHRIRENGKVENIRLGQLIVRDNNVCYLCNGCCDREDYTITRDGHFIVGKTYPSIDHVVPISKGGTHTWDNVKLTCFSCNTIKSDSSVKELALIK